jgi:hypothetical protein
MLKRAARRTIAAVWLGVRISTRSTGQPSWRRALLGDPLSVQSLRGPPRPDILAVLQSRNCKSRADLAIATLAMMVLLLFVAGPASADEVCRVVAGRNEDDLPKVAAKKCQPGETLFLGYRSFVPAIDVARACDATKPIVITGTSVICTFSGLKTIR